MALNGRVIPRSPTRKGGRFRWLTLALLTCLFFALSYSATEASAGAGTVGSFLARTAAEKPATLTAALPKRTIDVVVVLDNSASMHTCWPWKSGVPVPDDRCAEEERYKATDRDDRRYSAARLLVKLADPQDRLAFISFDTVGTPIGEGALKEVQDGSTLMAALNPPDDYSRRGQTRIDLGLAAAASLLTARSDADAQRPGYVLFLTDGVPAGPTLDESGDWQSQELAVVNTMRQLRDKGIVVYPVQLCAAEGCSIKPSQEAFTFLKNMHSSPMQVSNASDLASKFSQVFAEMKPDLHVIPGAGGHVEFTAEPKHGVALIDVVAPAGSPATMMVNSVDAGASSWGIDDRNITVFTSKEGVQTGKWTLDGADGLFAVVHTLAYPELAFPPANAAGQGERYVPANKEVLVLAYFAGVKGSMQDLFINNEPFIPFSTGDNQSPALGMRVLPAFAGQKTYTLQIGRAAPGTLEITRSFTFIADEALPNATTLQPEGCSAGQPCDLAAWFEGNEPLTDLKGKVYINDPNVAAENSSVYVADLQCDEATRKCSDKSFVPEEDRAYTIIYTLEARMASGQKLYFGDWTKAELNIRPTISVKGLEPLPLDLRLQPEDGWPIVVESTGKGDYGQLVATLVLTNSEGQRVLEVSPQLGEEMQHTQGTKTTTLKVSGYDNLPVGTYNGEIRFALQSPPPSPPNMQVPIAVSYVLGKSQAIVLARKLDFGVKPYSADSTEMLAITRSLQVEFLDPTFPLVPGLVEQSTCDEYGVTIDVLTEPPSGSPAGIYDVEFLIRSTKNVPSLTCTGFLPLTGSDEDAYDVSPQPIRWNFTVAEVTWKPIGGVSTSLGSNARVITNNSIAFSDMTYRDEVGRAQLEVEYTGTPPFTLVAESLSVPSSEGKPALSGVDLQWAVLSTPIPTEEEHKYTLDVSLVVKSDMLPHEWLTGAEYDGTLYLSVPELPAGTEGAKPQSISFSFKSTSWFQRNILLVAAIALLTFIVVIKLKQIGVDHAPVSRPVKDKPKGPPPVPSRG